MLRREILKSLIVSPLVLLAKKPKPQLKVEDLLKWKDEQKNSSHGGFSAKRWANNGCPGLTNVEASPYPHERIWAEDDLTTSNNSPLYCWVSYEDYICIPANLKFGNGENDIHASWDELGDVNGWYWKVS